MAGNVDDCRACLRWFRDAFKSPKSGFFLEIQPHQTPEQIAYNKFLVENSKALDIPLVATSDSHHACGMDIEYNYMMNRDDDHGKNLDLPFGTFRQVACLPPESIWRTCEIADSCDTPKVMPDKAYFPGCEQSDIDWMIEQARETRPNNKRLEYEIEIIQSLGFMPYFVALWKLRKWCKLKGIIWGAGRGSVAGSLFAYAIGITDVDPVRYGLYFERFLNPDRVSLPDIDIDIEDERRDEVLAYFKRQYGQCYSISTYTEVGFKTAIRDASKIHGYSPVQAGAWAKLLPDSVRGVDPTYDDCIEALLPYIPESVMETTKALVGKLKSLGRHAGGVVIVPEDYPLPVPVLVSKGVEQVAYDMGDVEGAGLVKYDILGLSTLTVVRRLRDQFGFVPDPLQSFDIKMMALIDNERLNGVFQVGSGGISQFTKRYRPTNLEEVSEVLALFRPGPLDSGIAEQVVNTRNGRLSTDNKPIFIYQEQIMRYAQEHAGYTLAEADSLRKAIGKKKPEELAKHAPKFDPETWELIVKFAAYAFNKSHSIAYAHLTHETLYWKAHHPAEFYASLIETNSDKPYKMVLAILEAKHDGIPILNPQSFGNWHTTTNDGSIVLGMNAVKGMKKQPKKPTARHKEILEDLSSSSYEKEMKHLRCSTRIIDVPKGHGLVCAKDKRTSMAGGIYYMLILDTKSKALEIYSKEDVELGSLIKIRG
jgi:DNA polymerase-3 subunit alpha